MRRTQTSDVLIVHDARVWRSGEEVGTRIMARRGGGGTRCPRGRGWRAVRHQTDAHVRGRPRAPVGAPPAPDDGPGGGGRSCRRRATPAAAPGRHAAEMHAGLASWTGIGRHAAEKTVLKINLNRRPR